MPENSVSNFIKASEKVFLLNNEDVKISHDIPFDKSYSGKIAITIEAIEPIFIRNHYEEGDKFYEITKKENGIEKKIRVSKEFCHYKKQPFIPGSSLKGIIRNLVEILSYGKLQGKMSLSTLENRYTDPSHKHRSEKLDLSDALFGTTDLKGRVVFSHLKVKGSFEYDDEKCEILATPEEKKGKIGWKNYPILDEQIKGKSGNNEKVKSYFIPLKSGVRFYGNILYHNLRDFELGALLSALTFHNTSDVYHNLGLAKSLGYGAIEIKIETEHLNEMLGAFEKKINAEIFDGKHLWHKSPYVKELLKKHSKKTDKEFLSYTSEDDIATIYLKIKNIQEKEKEEEKRRKKLKKMEQECQKAKESDDLSFLQHLVDTYPECEDIEDIKNKIENIKQSKQKDKHKELNEKAKRAWDELQKKKSNQKLYKKELDKFITKWGKEKNNKNSQYIKDLVEKANSLKRS